MSADYESLRTELMRRPVPREGVIVPRRSLEQLQHKDHYREADPYERWLAELARLTMATKIA